MWQTALSLIKQSIQLTRFPKLARFAQQECRYGWHEKFGTIANTYSPGLLLGRIVESRMFA